MSDYTQEIRLGREVLARAAEAYRKIRNTLRYLVANLYDFTPKQDALALADLEEVDRFILARYAEIALKVRKAYSSYDYGTIFQAINAFATVDLSAFYADVSKDRLYTFAARSRERRSAQTTMYIIADGVARLLAPILSFTTDELWQHLPERELPSVHMALFPEVASLEAMLDAPLLHRWERLTALRERVLAEIEPLRKNKQIGSSLQARVILTANENELAFLESHAAQLPMLFIVSDVELRPAPTDDDNHEEALPRVTIERAAGVKCERCWRYVPSVSTEPESAGLCSRCQDALAEPVHG
jgi:isoleucyl-tRNA synthetase